MRTNCTQEIRALLRAHSDGMTLEQVVWAVKRDKANVKKTIRAMPDAYIDRWEAVPRKQYAAVWCVVVPPEDCPRPENVDDMAISAVSKSKRQGYKSAQVQP
jgi:hypothetical protein